MKGVLCIKLLLLLISFLIVCDCYCCVLELCRFSYRQKDVLHKELCATSYLLSVM